MTEDKPHQYTTDDVNRIIRRALKIEQAEFINHQELLETAKELGIDPGKIEDAIKLEASTMEREKFKNDYLNRKRSAFKSKFWGFAILNSFIFIINVITPGPWWFQWVLLGTGISLAFGFRDLYFPTDENIDRARRRYKRRKYRSKRRRYQRFHRSEKNIFHH